MTFHNFTDGNVLYAAQLNALQWQRRDLTVSDTLHALGPGQHRVRNNNVADALGLPVRRIGSLTVEAIGATARTVRFTTDERDTGSHPLEIWQISTDNQGAFTTPWRRTFPPESAVESDSVDRIITSPNYEHPTEEGDLLIVPEPPVFFDDFTGTDEGAFPDGWTDLWGAATLAKVVGEPEATGGKALELRTPAGSNTFGISFDEPGIVEDAEVLLRFKPSHNLTPRPAVRLSGTSVETENSLAIYQNSLSPYNIMFNITTDGSSTGSPGTAVGPLMRPGPARWWLLRFRVFGADRMAAKVWPSGTPEPQEWQRTRGVAPFSSTGGKVGFRERSATVNPTFLIDWISVALDGGKAPSGGQ